jgi:hypothetical protein
VCCDLLFYTNIDDHGNHRGYMVRALAQLRNLVALHEATDALHWAMPIVPYCPGGMVIKIAIDLAFF